MANPSDKHRELDIDDEDMLDDDEEVNHGL